MVPTAFNVILYEPITHPKSVKHKQNQQANGIHTRVEQPFKIQWVRTSWAARFLSFKIHMPKPTAHFPVP